MSKINSLLFLCTMLVLACSEKKDEKLFTEQPGELTGVAFRNTVRQDAENHVLNYPYYFNGGGVAAGDINNDGLVDVYFTGNMVADRLYLNKGNFQFEDITTKAGVSADGWKTGVTMVDINQDGWLDIYVCRSAMGDSVLRKNLLFVNNGDQTFTENAELYGIADNSYSTHAAFFDYDRDGDLDLFVLNHSLPQYAGFNRLLVNYKNQKGDKFQSKLYRNNEGKFSDVSEKAGIINNVLSFGLGLAVSDVNADGWPDIYVSNDFNEEDYLYLNNQDGTFKNVVRDAMGHVSLFSMGSDIADVNNDAMPDIFTLDMLPETNERIKLSSGDDNYDKYRMLINSGFHHQTMRNMLQLNNGDGTFSEVGQLMGISNTDWSWSALFADFDGDGWKDLFVSNGYEKDYTNMQFLKFTVDERMKSRQTGAPPDIKRIIDQMPAIDAGNFLFRNNGDLTFTKKSEEWGISRGFKSNGAAYADLDNDGDPDLLINAMNAPAVLYRNNSVENNQAVFLSVDLVSQNPKRIVSGTKVYVYTGDTVQYHEFSPVRGFQSSMYGPLNIGLNGKAKADSIRIVWPDDKTQLVENVSANKPLVPRYEDARGRHLYRTKSKTLFARNDIIAWKQTPGEVNDFKRQFMLPRMYSPSGPKIASADVNHDGFQDVYICGPKGQGGVLFLQKAGGSFKTNANSAFENDKEFQDEDAIFFDADNDSDMDLYVVSGGYAFEENDPLLQDRLYLNDGSGKFTRAVKGIPSESNAGGCVEALDVDGDKDVDLFVGSRLIPGKYPVTPVNTFLINDGKGNFRNEIVQIATELENAGMVCDAVASDINKDGKSDLVVAGEWMALKIMINREGKLVDESSAWLPARTKGFWNCVISEDFDNDGDQDLVAGNAGLNNQLKVDAGHPATMVYKDFNNDGQVDPFFCYYIDGKSYPYASRDEALGQVSFLKSRFPDYTSYSNATLESIFTPAELTGAKTLQADLLKTVYLENTGNGFRIIDLPIQAQFAPVYAMAAFDVDHDGDKDLVMGGNETNVRVRIGKSDANRGFVFLNDGKGRFSYMSQALSGLDLNGDVRGILFIRSPMEHVMLVSETGDSITSYRLNN
jgi:enediyne biosynthesis protein E4